MADILDHRHRRSDGDRFRRITWCVLVHSRFHEGQAWVEDTELNGVETGDGLVEPMPATGRLAGVDFGSVRIGLATCDPSQTWVTPYDTYVRRSDRLDAEYFSSFAERERIQGWIVGLPIHCNGEESRKSSEARGFAQWLYKLTGRPIRMFDERFSSAEARKLLYDTGLSGKKKKQRIDRLAAYLILNHFIESHRRGDVPPTAVSEALD